MNEAQAQRIIHILKRAADRHHAYGMFSAIPGINQTWYVQVYLGPYRQFNISYATFYDVRLAIRGIRQNGA